MPSKALLAPRQYLALLRTGFDEEASDALEHIVEGLHSDKENLLNFIFQLEEFDDVIFKLISFLGICDERSAGNAAYVIGLLGDHPQGSARFVSYIKLHISETQFIFADLLRLLDSDDLETVMNSAGALASIVEEDEGRELILSSLCFDPLLRKLAHTMLVPDPWAASNSALVIARISMYEEGSARILSHFAMPEILGCIAEALGEDKAGRGQNAAFVLGRLFDHPDTLTRLNELGIQEFTMKGLFKMLHSTRSEVCKNACFALSSLASRDAGHNLVLRRIEGPVLLFRACNLLHSDNMELAWFAAILFHSFSNQLFGHLLIRRAPKLVARCRERLEHRRDLGLTEALCSALQAIVDTFQPPKAPSDFCAQVLSPYAARLSWKPLSPNNCLPLGYRVVNCLNQEILHISAECQLVLKKLRPFTDYCLAVQAFNQSDSGPFSNSVSFKTETTCPTEPLDILLRDVASTHLTVNWAPPAWPNGIILGYNVYLDEGEKPVYITQEQYVTLKNLTPDTDYHIQVCAVTSAGEGPKISLEATTNPPKAMTVPKPNIQVQGRNQMFAAWDTPDNTHGHLTKYELIMNDSLVVYSGSDHSRKITRLQPDTEYTFKLCVITTEGKFTGPKVRKRTHKDDYQHVHSTAPYYLNPPKMSAVSDSNLLKEYHLPAHVVARKTDFVGREDVDAKCSPEPQESSSASESQDEIEGMQISSASNEDDDHGAVSETASVNSHGKDPDNEKLQADLERPQSASPRFTLLSPRARDSLPQKANHSLNTEKEKVDEYSVKAESKVKLMTNQMSVKPENIDSKKTLIFPQDVAKTTFFPFEATKKITESTDRFAASENEQSAFTNCHLESSIQQTELGHVKKVSKKLPDQQEKLINQGKEIRNVNTENVLQESISHQTEFTRFRKEMSHQPKELANYSKEFANQPKEFANQPKEFANQLKQFANQPKEFDNQPNEYANQQAQKASSSKFSHSLNLIDQKYVQHQETQLDNDTSDFAATLIPSLQPRQGSNSVVYFSQHDNYATKHQSCVNHAENYHSSSSHNLLNLRTSSMSAVQQDRKDSSTSKIPDSYAGFEIIKDSANQNEFSTPTQNKEFSTEQSRDISTNRSKNTSTNQNADITTNQIEDISTNQNVEILTNQNGDNMIIQQVTVSSNRKAQNSFNKDFSEEGDPNDYIPNNLVPNISPHRQKNENVSISSNHVATDKHSSLLITPDHIKDALFNLKDPSLRSNSGVLEDNCFSKEITLSGKDSVSLINSKQISQDIDYDLTRPSKHSVSHLTQVAPNRAGTLSNDDTQSFFGKSKLQFPENNNDPAISLGENLTDEKKCAKKMDSDRVVLGDRVVLDKLADYTLHRQVTSGNVRLPERRQVPPRTASIVMDHLRMRRSTGSGDVPGEVFTSSAANVSHLDHQIVRTSKEGIIKVPERFTKSLTNVESTTNQNICSNYESNQNLQNEIIETLEANQIKVGDLIANSQTRSSYESSLHFPCQRDIIRDEKNSTFSSDLTSEIKSNQQTKPSFRTDKISLHGVNSAEPTVDMLTNTTALAEKSSNHTFIREIIFGDDDKSVLFADEEINKSTKKLPKAKLDGKIVHNVLPGNKMAEYSANHSLYSKAPYQSVYDTQPAQITCYPSHKQKDKTESFPDSSRELKTDKPILSYVKYDENSFKDGSHGKFKKKNSVEVETNELATIELKSEYNSHELDETQRASINAKTTELNSEEQPTTELEQRDQATREVKSHVLPDSDLISDYSNAGKLKANDPAATQLKSDQESFSGYTCKSDLIAATDVISNELTAMQVNNLKKSTECKDHFDEGDQKIDCLNKEQFAKYDHSSISASDSSHPLPLVKDSDQEIEPANKKFTQCIISTNQAFPFTETSLFSSCDSLNSLSNQDLDCFTDRTQKLIDETIHDEIMSTGDGHTNFLTALALKEGISLPTVAVTSNQHAPDECEESTALPSNATGSLVIPVTAMELYPYKETKRTHLKCLLHKSHKYHTRTDSRAQRPPPVVRATGAILPRGAAKEPATQLFGWTKNAQESGRLGGPQLPPLAGTIIHSKLSLEPSHRVVSNKVVASFMEDPSKRLSQEVLSPRKIPDSNSLRPERGPPAISDSSRPATSALEVASPCGYTLPPVRVHSSTHPLQLPPPATNECGPIGGGAFKPTQFRTQPMNLPTAYCMSKSQVVKTLIQNLDSKDNPATEIKPLNNTQQTRAAGGVPRPNAPVKSLNKLSQVYLKERNEQAVKKTMHRNQIYKDLTEPVLLFKPKGTKGFVII